jgi:dTDP-4-dehydrorhamnose reductase
MKIVVLGATGMLGDAVVQVFADSSAELFASARALPITGLPDSFTGLELDAEQNDLAYSLANLSSGDFVINCIGIIRTEIDESNASSCARAEHVNAVFPAQLARFAEQRGVRVIQIATDCVYSGKKGHYTETDPHDPADLYGKTKSAGEIASSSMLHLRVSIIGREKRGFTSLFEWVVRQQESATILGYVNHKWNGISAKHFAKLCRAIIEHDLFSAGLRHILPQDEVSKADLVRLIAAHEGRDDLEIYDGRATQDIDRTLSTNSPEFSASVWNAAGFETPPTIAQLVTEI